MDEPFGPLDVFTRTQLQEEILRDLDEVEDHDRLYHP